MNIYDFARKRRDATLHLGESLLQFSFFHFQVIRPHRNGHRLQDSVELAPCRFELFKRLNSLSFVHLFHPWRQHFFSAQLGSLSFQICSFFFIFIQVFWHLSVVFMNWSLFRVLCCLSCNQFSLFTSENDDFRVYWLFGTYRI